MLFRPDRREYRAIGYYVGWVLIGVAAAMAVPAAAATAYGEVASALTFVIGAALPLSTGVLLSRVCRTEHDPGWGLGIVTAALVWLVAPLFGAVPLFLSGHYGRFLDAYFDAMSGFATAGLAVVNDLDHLPDSVNLWRHLLQYIGGQGLVLVVLSFFTAGRGGVSMYVGEAREDRILPKVRSTARFILRVSLTWLAAATPVLWAALIVAGYGTARALFHALTLFMAPFSTGGYAPSSASVALYHSPLLEALLAVVMVAGATSFGLHYLLWRRRFAIVRRHLETRAFLACLMIFLTIAAIGLLRVGAYTSAEPLLRRGVFTLLSAQTSTGFATVPSRTLVSYWGALAPAMVVTAMATGAMSGSTGGGIKTVRIGVLLKSIRQDLLKVLAPADAVVIERLNADQPRVLSQQLVRSAATVLLLFFGLYGLGALVGMFYGYPFEEAFFESVSAAATVGLSVGITGPTLQTGLKVVYIVQVWIGRLELIAVLALFGFVYTTVRGRR